MIAHLSSNLFIPIADRWSQEENSAVTQREMIKPIPMTNGVATVNGIHQTPADHPGQSGGVCATSSGERHSEQSLLNNNLIEEKCNLRCVDEKSYCLYHKFPAKVNNNVYPEKGTSVKDGMDEYFQRYASHGSNRQSTLPQSQPVARRNELSPSRDPRRYPDQLNLLNGEEEDEDEGCIYTYKGENFEANLSHLIDMCLSCGLPNTERSVDGREPLVHRLRAGQPDPAEQNNLFSPEMDFLEMDFDPGPNGDGDIDSDCEDNCLDECDTRLNRDNAAAFSVAGAVSPISVLDRKANNYCSEMRNLMCKRCESSICDGKIDNMALNLTLHDENHSPLNIGRGPSAGLDDRPVQEGRSLNVPSSGMNLPKDLNVELNEFCDERQHILNASVSQSQEDEYDPPDNDSIENNLGEADIMDMDEFCEDADDEDGDDSNSERYDLGTRYVRAGSSGDTTLRDREDQGGPGHSISCKAICKTTNKVNNNNLGSVSAPEVSPSKEYSPLEKFGRSISFHNQLSSPKYENVCFSQRPKKEDRPYESQQAKKTVATEIEAANIEACTGRLHRRENSVFNILSDPSSSQVHMIKPLLFIILFKVCN